ncbi:hypothetical protein CRG98_021553 [Punica granatum]|uniref:Prolamin-like domain-containing protein n=1 Tax=Punica granatum TaxID=22663 RepID=A0A2I0JQ85_PUNGR|nr:hypothetical protein CRG98_021553 [Punica granatum]
MEKHQMPLPRILVVLTIFGALLIEGRSNYPWEGEQLALEPRKGWNAFIKKCASTLTNGCDRQLYDYIFYRRQDLEINCCYKLARMGETCHKAISYSISRVKRFTSWKGHIYNRSIEGYEDCVRRT